MRSPRGCSGNAGAAGSSSWRRSSSRARATTRTSPSGRPARGYAELRVDGERLPTARWPRLDRFREHTIELPAGSVQVSAATEARAARGAAARARSRQGRGARARAGAEARATQDARLLDAPRLPVAAAAVSPSPIRGSSRTTRSTAGARRASAPACAIDGLRRRADRRGDLVERVVRRRGNALRVLRGPAAESGRAQRPVPRALDRGARGAAGRIGARVLRRARAARARGRDRARPARRDRLTACVPA